MPASFTGQESGNHKVKLIHFAVVLLFMFGFRFLPPFGGLETKGMEILGIFIGSVYGWIAVDLTWTSLIGMVALGTTQTMTFQDVLSAGLGSQYFVLTAMMLFLAAALTELDLTNVIISKLFNLKWIQGKPWCMVFIFLFAVFLVAMMTNLMVSTVVFLELYRGLAKKANIPPHHKLNSVFLGGISMADSMGEISLPFKTSVIIILGIYAAGMGVQPNMAKYLLCALPTAILALMLYCLTCKYILRIDASCIKDSGFSVEEVKATKRQKVFLALFAALVVCLLLPSILPANLGITALLNNIGVGGISILFVALMMLVRVDGKPLLELGPLMKHYSFPMLIIMGYFTPLASAFSSDDVGIKTALVNLFQPILGNLSSYGFVVAIVLITVILTNFLNNLPIGSIFVSLVVVLAGDLAGVNIYAVVVMLIFACFISIVLPPANVPNAVIYGQRDLITFKNQFTVTFTCAVVFVLFLLTVGYGAFSLIL